MPRHHSVGTMPVLSRIILKLLGAEVLTPFAQQFAKTTVIAPPFVCCVVRSKFVWASGLCGLAVWLVELLCYGVVYCV